MISVGIDVSKGKSMVCVLKPQGEIIGKPYEIHHTRSSVCKLVKYLKSLTDELKVIMEPTGHYHIPLVNILLNNGIFVSLVNPLKMKKYSDVTLRKGKTDKRDSIKIAEYGISYWHTLREYVHTDELYKELDILSRQYYQYLSRKIKSKLTLIGLLDKVMPGIVKHVSSDKIGLFVKKYWHYDNIIKLSETAFIISYAKWAKKERCHQNETKARKIYALASDSITTLDSKKASTKMLILESVRALKEIKYSTSLILSHMRKTAMQLKEYKVIRDMPGIGDILASRLIAAIGDVRRFHSGKALVAYAGIDAPPYESGAFVGNQRHISKRGSKYIRKTAYEIMTALKITKPTRDDSVYKFILKKIAEGKPNKVAKVAGINKLLRIYYARVHEVYA